MVACYCDNQYSKFLPTPWSLDQPAIKFVHTTRSLEPLAAWNIALMAPPTPREIGTKGDLLPICQLRLGVKKDGVPLEPSRVATKGSIAIGWEGANRAWIPGSKQLREM